MFAHFFKAAGGGFELIITRSPAINTGVVVRVPVGGKREARAVAAEHNATPWNF